MWEIEDVGPVDAAEIAKKVERTFGIIRQRTDTLLTALGLSDERATSSNIGSATMPPHGSDGLHKVRSL